MAQAIKLKELEKEMSRISRKVLKESRILVENFLVESRT